jgi:hypothetical protein
MDVLCQWELWNLYRAYESETIVWFTRFVTRNSQAVHNNICSGYDEGEISVRFCVFIQLLSVDVLFNLKWTHFGSSSSNSVKDVGEFTRVSILIATIRYFRHWINPQQNHDSKVPVSSKVFPGIRLTLILIKKHFIQTKCAFSVRECP